jgi:hypothetical protein
MKPFTLVASVIFALVAIAHLARVILGWTVTIGGFDVPSWMSIVACVASAILAIMIRREARK